MLNYSHKRILGLLGGSHSKVPSSSSDFKASPPTKGIKFYSFEFSRNWIGPSWFVTGNVTSPEIPMNYWKQSDNVFIRISKPKVAEWSNMRKAASCHAPPFKVFSSLKRCGTAWDEYKPESGVRRTESHMDRRGSWNVPWNLIWRNPKSYFMSLTRWWSLETIKFYKIFFFTIFNQRARESGEGWVKVGI